ncbi:MAG: hypothetical protein KJ077_41745 [Anaerolineae bacterium]|nr:hypothetical protein [Anaerolineae bacterium]
MKEMENIEVTTLVDQLLRSANLTLTTEEQAALVQIYPKVRGLVQRLRLPEARYAEPAAVFRASLSQPEV